MNSSEFYVDPWFVITKQSIKKTKYPILLLRGIKLGISLIKHWLSMFIAERQVFEPITLTAYMSATLLSKFQIGNETVTIFNR